MLNMEHLRNTKIAITGASGFLGRHLLRKLKNSGADITCLARATSSRKYFPANTHVITGDCATGAGLHDLMAGADIFIHLASMLFGVSWTDYLKYNSLACQHITEIWHTLPEGERPQKIIFVSSLAAAGPCGTLPGIDEKAIPAPVSAYGWSKFLCEKIFQAAIPRDLVILRPAIIYGSGDRGLLPMFKSAARGLGISPGFDRLFPVSVIHADDAAQAIILACQKKSCGIYHLDDGAPTNMDAFCRAMGQALHVKNMRVAHFPLPIMGLTAACSSGWAVAASAFARLAGRNLKNPPHWNMDKFREARQAGWLADSSRIRDELGFCARVSLEQGMEETVAGYREEGWL